LFIFPRFLQLRQTNRWHAHKSLNRAALLLERLEPRSLLTPNPVNPNSGWITNSQFQPWGFAVVGTQLAEVTAGHGAAVRILAPHNGKSKASPKSDIRQRSAVNSGLVDSSQFNAGGFGTIGTQLSRTRIGGGFLIDAVDDSIGLASEGGLPTVVTLFGPKRATIGAPAGEPDQVVNSGKVQSSQFNDGGFGTIGLQARNVTIGGDLSIVTRTSTASTRGKSNGGRFDSQPMPNLTSNQGIIGSSQFNDGGFGNVGLQWRDVNLGGSLEVGMQTTTISPGSVNSLGRQWQLYGSYAKGASTVRLGLSASSRLPESQAQLTQAVNRLYPGMSVSGTGIQPGTSIVSILGKNAVQLSKPTTSAARTRPIFFFIDDTATNTGHIESSQFADGGFGDIGMQWFGVSVGGRVATRSNALEIQPERNSPGITKNNLTFGRIQPADLSKAANALPLTPDLPLKGPAGSTPSAGGTSQTNDATNSGVIRGSQFADGGFGDMGLQWRGVQVAGDVQAIHNSLSIQPENQQQGPISVSNVAYPSVAAPFAPSSPLPVLPAMTDPAVINNGAPISPILPTPTNPGPTSYKLNEATNSGLIAYSQFADGGFGDIGLQWSDVNVLGSVQVVHNTLSIQPEGGSLAGVAVTSVRFGDPVPAAAPDAHGPLAPATLASLIVSTTPAGPPPGWVPDPMFNRHPNSTNQNNQQYLSNPASAASFQWSSSSFNGSQFTVANNVLTVVNSTSNPSTITLANITFPGSIPPLPQVSAATAAQQWKNMANNAQVDAATNSGTILNNQFLDGGMGDIGLQWRGVTVLGPVSITHNSLSIETTGNANGEVASLGPIVVAGVSFNSGLDNAAAPSPGIYVTPPAIDQHLPSVQAAASPESSAGIVENATNSASLTGGQFLDGGFGAIGMQWQNVVIRCPVHIVNNVLSIVVSGAASSGITVRDVVYA